MVIADFIDVLTALNAAGARYIVTGGAAVVLHGCDRQIADLDVIVDRAPTECDRVTNALWRAGFFPTIPLSLDQTVVMTFFDQQGRRVDVHVRNLFPFGEMSERSWKVTVGGVGISVIALDDLIEIKRRTRSSDPDVGPLLALSGLR